MKKHILGAAVFGFIFAAFAFAFFYAPPIPQVEEVKFKFEGVKLNLNSEKTSCFRNSKKMSVEVVNSQYFFDQDVIISEVKLKWNGSGAPPKMIYLRTMISSSEQEIGNLFSGNHQIFVSPFYDSAEKTFRVVLHGSENKKINKQDNLYVVADVSDAADGEADRSFSERKEVVFVHGENSIIGK